MQSCSVQLEQKVPKSKFFSKAGCTILNEVTLNNKFHWLWHTSCNPCSRSQEVHHISLSILPLICWFSLFRYKTRNDCNVSIYNIMVLIARSFISNLSCNYIFTGPQADTPIVLTTYWTKNGYLCKFNSCFTKHLASHFLSPMFFDVSQFKSAQELPKILWWRYALTTVCTLCMFTWICSHGTPFRIIKLPTFRWSCTT